MSTPFGYFDLLEAFSQPGCAVCRLLERDVERYLDTLLYEYPTDPTTQNQFRASRGLCHTHTWQLPGFNSVLPTAVLYNAALDEVLQVLRRTPPTERGRRRGSNALADALEAQKPCPACVLRDGAEQRYLKIMGEYAAEERFGVGFRQSEGLCLPHFRGALRLARGAAQQQALAEVQVEQYSKLKRELETFLHKMDAHYHEKIGAEATSWQRTLARMVGEKGFN